ncbi:MAG: LysR family transcriptional regulator [Proteobacteria bacterium]|nr:LysR family transcriptional regulator [Pseudomonadota bacterium]
MDISLLKTFLEVGRTRHFSRAAENLFVTSAAVSARIKLLEHQLGAQLFVRHRGNMQLTNEGERLVPFAQTLIQTWNRALQEVSLQPDMESRIHIGATSSMWVLAMQERLLDLIARRPGIAVRAEGHPNEDLARLLIDRSLDLVLLPEPPNTTGFHAERIGELTLVLASNQQTELSKAMVENYIYVDWGADFGDFHARRLGEAARPWFHANLASIALSIMQSRGGAAFLPVSLVMSDATLHPVPDAPSFKRPIFACYQEGNVRRETISYVVELLRGTSI